MGRLKSTEETRRVAHAGSLLANLKPVVVLGLATLQPNIVGNRFVRHVPAAAHEVATAPQVPTPKRRPQPSVVLEEMMRGLPLNRLHHTTRREMGRGTQQQMDMVGPHVPLENLDVLTATDFPDQIPQAMPDLPTSTGLRYFVVNTKW